MTGCPDLLEGVGEGFKEALPSLNQGFKGLPTVSEANAGCDYDRFMQAAHAYSNPQKPALVYPAIVQSIFRRESESKDFIFGYGKEPSRTYTDYDPKSPYCGQITGVMKCPAGDGDGHDKFYTFYRCNNPLCPVCYVKFISRISQHAAARVMGFKSVYPDALLYHLILSPPEGTNYENMNDAFSDAHKQLKPLGVTSATVVYHPYRVKKEIKQQLRKYRRENGLNERVGFWEMIHDNVLNLTVISEYYYYSPHFHAEATGYLLDSGTFHNKTGWIYKKRRYLSGRDEIQRLLYYLASHACYEAGRHSIRYYGDVSYVCLHAKKTTSEIAVICRCGARLERFSWDDETGAPGAFKGLATQKQDSYLYWKRGDIQPHDLLLTAKERDIATFKNRVFGA